MSNDFLWVEKYRPEKISDAILPDRLKSTFQAIVDSGEIPNMLFTGTAGPVSYTHLTLPTIYSV